MAEEFMVDEAAQSIMQGDIDVAGCVLCQTPYQRAGMSRLAAVPARTAKDAAVVTCVGKLNASRTFLGT